MGYRLYNLWTLLQNTTPLLIDPTARISHEQDILYIDTCVIPQSIHSTLTQSLTASSIHSFDPQQ